MKSTYKNCTKEHEYVADSIRPLKNKLYTDEIQAKRYH